MHSRAAWTLGALFLGALAASLWWLGGRSAPPAPAVTTMEPSGRLTGRLPEGRIDPAPETRSAADMAVELEPLGEVPLADGSVERVYRVVLRNGPRPRHGLSLELLDAGPGVEVVEPWIRIGETLPGAELRSADTVTLRHPVDAPPDAAAVRWRVHEESAAPRTIDDSYQHPPPDPEPEFDDHRDR